MFAKILLLLVLLVALTPPLFAKELTDVPDAAHFTLMLDNKPFQEVAADISRQTGYRVVYDEKWNTLPVSGNYSDVSLDEFFRRAFRKQNTSLLVNDRERVVAIRFFGDKSFADLLASVTPGKAAAIPEDIAELHREQRAELQEYLRDPESVDPLSGVKLTDIRAMREEQHAAIEQMRQDPEAIDPISGATMGDLQQLNAAQQREIEQMRNDPASVDPESGMTVGAIAEMHQAQRAERDRMLQDPNTVDPISGMKLSEIWAISKKTE